MSAPLNARGQRIQPTIKVFIRDEFGAVDLVEGALVRAPPHAFGPGRLGKRHEAGGNGANFRAEPLAAGDRPLTRSTPPSLPIIGSRQSASAQ